MIELFEAYSKALKELEEHVKNVLTFFQETGLMLMLDVGWPEVAKIRFCFLQLLFQCARS